jgi:hypothetical protein
MNVQNVKSSARGFFESEGGINAAIAVLADELRAAIALPDAHNNFMSIRAEWRGEYQEISGCADASADTAWARIFSKVRELHPEITKPGAPSAKASEAKAEKRAEKLESAKACIAKFRNEKAALTHAAKKEQLGDKTKAQEIRDALRLLAAERRKEEAAKERDAARAQAEARNEKVRLILKAAETASFDALEEALAVLVLSPKDGAAQAGE